MKGPAYWRIVRWIIESRCLNKGIPINRSVSAWIERKIEIQKERWEMKLSRSVQV